MATEHTNERSMGERREGDTGMKGIKERKKEAQG
jgi:hypothetical protein